LYLHPSRKRYANTARGEMLDTCLLARVPHSLAVLICFAISGVFLNTLFGIIAGAFAEFAAQEAVKVSQGEKPMGDKLNELINDLIDGLEDCCCLEGCAVDSEPGGEFYDDLGKCRNPDPLCSAAKGMGLRRDVICSAQDGIPLAMRMVATDEPGLQALKLYVYDGFKTMATGTNITGESQFKCERKKVFGTSEGMTPDELTATLGAFVQPLADGSLIFLLAIYILLERGAGGTISGDHIVFLQMEGMIKNYVSLKTILSAMTGVLTATILSACKVPLGAVFGLLAFLLNYIPSVGSMIAMVLPIPIIVLDENLTFNEKIIGFAGPAAVQGYIGNALEPALFGASLNLTTMSVLLALVFFAAVWGLNGACLSVPLLGAIKIVLHHTDHPMAKACLTLIREDRTLDFISDRELMETIADYKRSTDVAAVDLDGTSWEYNEDDKQRKTEQFAKMVEDERLYGER